MAKMMNLNDLIFLQQTASNIKNERWDHERLGWDIHVEQLNHEGSFSKKYLMTLPTHGKLFSILDPFVQRKEPMSRGAEPILVEHIVGVGLRVLSGGRTIDQRHIIGSCLHTAYVDSNAFIDAVNAAPELDIQMPGSHNE